MIDRIRCRLIVVGECRVIIWVVLLLISFLSVLIVVLCLCIFLDNFLLCLIKVWLVLRIVFLINLFIFMMCV